MCVLGAEHKLALSNSAKPYGTKVCFFILRGNLHFEFRPRVSTFKFRETIRYQSVLFHFAGQPLF
jgi:hypothetical protein